MRATFKISRRFIRFFEVDRRIGKALHFSWDIPLALRHENGDRSSQNKIVIRGPPPHHHSIRSSHSGCLAVRSIFLLPVREDRHRLVHAVRRAHGFERSGGHRPAPPFLPAVRPRGAAARLPTALKQGLVSVPRGIELGLEPPRPYVVLSYLGYLTGIVGTGIWGYGDLLLRLNS